MSANDANDDMDSGNNQGDSTPSKAAPAPQKKRSANRVIVGT